MSKQHETVEHTRESLKILALREKLSQVMDENADLRVEVTVLTHQLQKALEVEEVSTDDDSD